MRCRNDAKAIQKGNDLHTIDRIYRAGKKKTDALGMILHIFPNRISSGEYSVPWKNQYILWVTYLFNSGTMYLADRSGLYKPKLFRKKRG
ncbi:MAG: hypothetical protein ACTSYI_06870 [Promethearchaeota archaeon]